MKQRMLSIVMMGLLGFICLAGCGAQKAEQKDVQESLSVQADTQEDSGKDLEEEPVTITVFAAASLSSVMDELIQDFIEQNPQVEILTNYDSSGTLMTQIQEGAACDVFFSAAQKQMNTLEEAGLLLEGTRHNVVNNQVCVVSYKGSNTAVTGLENLSQASSLALADGSVPVGKYTRQAMVALGILPESEDVSKITTGEISEALGGVEINECGNVSKVTSAIVEGANEAGTVYRSDTYGFEDQLDILQVVDYSLSGDVIYPVAQIANVEASQAQLDKAEEFIQFLISQEAKEVFEAYYFDTDVE